MTIMQTIKAYLGFRSETQKRAETLAMHADALASETRELNEKLRPYAESDDPFKALLIDLSNQRASRAQLKGWDE